jgi:hypothetical protein
MSESCRSSRWSWCCARTCRPWEAARARLCSLPPAGVVAASALALPYLDGLAQAFGFVALPLDMVAVSLLIVAVTEWAKGAFYARRRHMGLRRA